MMTDLITPPSELLDQWCMDATLGNWRDIATQSAQWGADQELETCCEWITGQDLAWTSFQLRAARRPKPPHLKDQALYELNNIYNRDKIDDTTYDTIRRALEQLDD